jgi:hypothetical protein
MVIRSRATQDRRGISRLIARLDCEFIYEGVGHKAVLVDLSLRGAFLSSKYLPPKGGHVTVTLQPPHVKKTLTLDGKVIRGGWGMSEHGELSRFGIQFSHSPSDLIELIGKLIS